MPGVDINGEFPNYQVIIRGYSTILGDNSAMLMLDGFEVDASVLSAVDFTRIAFIDKLTGAQASMFGGRGSAGVIAVYTKTGLEPTSTREYPGIMNYTHPGYYKARTFYKPDYASKKPEHIKPDYRTTLHWEPNIITDDSGKTSISFYTSDQKGKYSIIVEGITMDGIPVRAVHKIETE